MCCGTGTGTGTAGTVTFCLSGTGTRTRMHYGSGYRIEFGAGSNIKCNEKVKKSKLEASFLGNNAAADIEKARFCRIFLLLENCEIVWIRNQNRSRSRSRNQNFLDVGTATAIAIPVPKHCFKKLCFSHQSITIIIRLLLSFLTLYNINTYV